MDPLTALNLTCNIAQVVEFGLKAVSIVRQTYRDGIAHDLADLNVLSVHIEQAALTIRDSLLGPNYQGALSRDDSEIRDLAVKSIEISSRLQEKIGSLRSTGGRFNALKRTFRSISSRSTIVNLENALHKCRSALETRILSRLHTLLREGLTANIDDFANLDQDLQNFILRLEEGESKVAKLVAEGTANTKNHITAEHSTTRAAIKNDLTLRELTTANEAKYTKLLNSLRFETMNARANQVAEAHLKTFEWVFHDDVPQPWPDFREWLRNTGSLYWISGKPGSGKSTLMKFLSQHTDTKTALAANVPQGRILTVPFFFWKGGSPEQRNIHGFLCSLAYQLLEAGNEALSQLLKAKPQFKNKITTSDWSSHELELTLDTTTKFIAGERMICFFIDGLDELNEKEDWFSLARFIQQLASIDNVKVCVSSRPEPHICEDLQKYPYLRLQDLNKGDIETYVRSTLGAETVTARFSHSENGTMDKIINEVLKKADGVFLWVVLALKDVLRRLSYRNTWESLLHRLNRLPSDIEELYKDMWRRLNEDYKPFQREASLFFRAFLKLNAESSSENNTCSLFLFMATVLDWPQKIHDKPQCFDKMEELDVECGRTKELIELRSAGLLEVINLPKNKLYEEAPLPQSEDYTHAYEKLRWTHRYCQVVAIHRTAIDFLQDTEAGREIMSHCEMPDEQLLVRSIRTSLLSQLLNLTYLDLNRMRWLLNRILCSGSNQKMDLLKSMADVSHLYNGEVKSAREASFPIDGQRSIYRLAQNHNGDLHCNSSLYELACYATDFTGFSLQHDVCLYYFHERQLWSNRSQNLTRSYKDYLLLCASVRPSCTSCGVCLADLLNLGANPASVHYSPMDFPLRTTPWAMILISERLMELAWEIMMFLERGAGFDDKMVVGISNNGQFVLVNELTYKMDKRNSRPRLNERCDPRLLLEVNALFLMQQRFENEIPPQLKDHPKCKDVTPYARVLLIMTEPEVGFPIEEKASDSLVKAVVALGTCERKQRYKYERDLEVDTKNVQAQAVQGSTSVRLRPFLQAREYYKPPADPAVWKGPVPRFEDSRDEHGRIIDEEIESTNGESQEGMSDRDLEGYRENLCGLMNETSYSETVQHVFQETYLLFCESIRNHLPYATSTLPDFHVEKTI